jgi:hypothetical protein
LSVSRADKAWAYSSSGRTSALQAEGAEFESPWVHVSMGGVELQKDRLIQTISLGEELIDDADQFAAELIQAGRSDLAEWPLATAQRVRDRNDRLLEMKRELDTPRWSRFLFQVLHYKPH